MQIEAGIAPKMLPVEAKRNFRSGWRRLGRVRVPSTLVARARCGSSLQAG
jgi:hypothetical protein